MIGFPITCPVRASTRVMRWPKLSPTQTLPPTAASKSGYRRPRRARRRGPPRHRPQHLTRVPASHTEPSATRRSRRIAAGNRFVRDATRDEIHAREAVGRSVAQSNHGPDSAFPYGERIRRTTHVDGRVDVESDRVTRTSPASVAAQTAPSPAASTPENRSSRTGAPTTSLMRGSTLVRVPSSQLPTPGGPRRQPWAQGVTAAQPAPRAFRPVRAPGPARVPSGRHLAPRLARARLRPRKLRYSQPGRTAR